MAKKAKKSTSVHKAKPKAAKKPKHSSAKSPKSPSSTAKKTNSLYATPPKETLVRPKSVTIPLKESEPLSYSTTPSFAPSIPVSGNAHSSSMEMISRASSGVHSFGAVVFLTLSAVGYLFSLIFVSRSDWLSFLFSLAVMVICLDSFMASIYRREEAKHPMQPIGIDNLHQLTMHLFLLLALIAVVFGVAFWLEGKWIMLLLSAGAAVVAFDNMLVAKKKHEIH